MELLKIAAQNVLILLLMDDGRWGDLIAEVKVKGIVLILLLMDDGRWELKTR